MSKKKDSKSSFSLDIDPILEIDFKDLEIF